VLVRHDNELNEKKKFEVKMKDRPPFFIYIIKNVITFNAAFSELGE
jgi:hypothetical protein